MASSSTNTTDGNQLPNSATSNTLESISEVNVYEEAVQQRIAPHNIATGAQTGQMQVQGIIAVVDKNRTRRIMFGYEQEAF